MVIIEEAKTKKTDQVFFTTKIFSKVLYKTNFCNKKGNQVLLGIDILKDDVKKELLSLAILRLEEVFTKLSALISLPVLKSVKQRVDPREYNGASLVGLQGVVVKSHGGADSYAFSQAINTAYYEVKNELLNKIESLIQSELSNE